MKRKALYVICNTHRFAHLIEYGEYKVVKSTPKKVVVVNNAGHKRAYSRQVFY